MPMEDMQTISVVFAGSVIIEWFGKLVELISHLLFRRSSSVPLVAGGVGSYRGQFHRGAVIMRIRRNSA
jgi:hypothetical protein